MAREMPKAVKRRMETAPAAVIPEDKLDRIREAAAVARAQKIRKQELAEDLERVSADLLKSITETLPKLMEEAGITSLTIEGSGNSPKFDLKMKPFYRASIPAEWPEERRQAAFDHLEERNAGDLIRTVVSFDFPKESHEDVGKFIELISKLSERYSEVTGKGLRIPAPIVKNSVHHGTLSSWLKEEMELSAKRGDTLPKLDVIGAMVGKVAEIKDRSDG